jgi:hypothetical protein
MWSLLFCLSIGVPFVDGFNAARSFSHPYLAHLSPLRTSQVRPTYLPCNSLPPVPKASRQASVAADDSFLASADEREKKEKIIVEKQKSMVPATTFNLIKAVAGSGVLALPAGVAAMSDYKKRSVMASMTMYSSFIRLISDFSPIV